MCYCMGMTNNDRSYQIRLNVRGASDEAYARAALQIARGDGIDASSVLRITRTTKGAVVTVA